MALENVRFTPAQRDALIDLAARLQAEHEATVGMNELATAARKAGIDPRFLDEAARRLETVSPPVVEPGPQEAVLALAGLAAFNALFFGILVRHWFFPLAPVPGMVMFGATAFAFSWTFGRARALRWVAPLAPIAIWIALGVGSVLIYRLKGVWGARDLVETAIILGFIQVVSAGFASLLRRFA